MISARIISALPSASNQQPLSESGMAARERAIDVRAVLVAGKNEVRHCVCTPFQLPYYANYPFPLSGAGKEHKMVFDLIPSLSDSIKTIGDFVAVIAAGKVNVGTMLILAAVAFIGFRTVRRVGLVAVSLLG